MLKFVVRSTRSVSGYSQCGKSHKLLAWHQRRMRLFPGSYIGLDETSAGMRSPATSMLKPPSGGFGTLAVST